MATPNKVVNMLGKSYRDNWSKQFIEQNLSRAIEEQKKNDKIRRVCWWMIGVGFVCLFIFFLPACCAIVLGGLGIFMYRGNSVMKLTKIGDEYFPNP